MKKIAMINCLRAGRICAGAACMDAFNNRKASFAEYGEEELQLTAFMRCNGCDVDPGEDKGTLDKLGRIIRSRPDAVHFGICTKKQKSGQECEIITRIAGMLEDRGINTVRGTH